jgi:hypothetical protein
MPQTWNYPTVQAQPCDFIRNSFVPLLQILSKISYPNGNILLTLTRTFSVDFAQAVIDRAYLLAPTDQVIASPTFHYGDIVSARGTFQPFDTYLAAGVSIEEISYQDHNSLLQAWDVLLNGQPIGDVIWETDRGCSCNGLHYRSVYQAANVAAEEFTARKLVADREPVF